METFSVKFRAAKLDLIAVVPQYDHHQKFKAKMGTDEAEPVILKQSVDRDCSFDQLFWFRPFKHKSEVYY